jgi:isochorismate pyruvate lyase
VRPPEECASIEDVRLGIDALDREIIALIGRRAHYVEAAARFKTGESSVRAPERRKAMLEARRRWAEEEGLSPEVIEAVYETLVAYFIDREMAHWRDTPP